MARLPAEGLGVAAREMRQRDEAQRHADLGDGHLRLMQQLPRLLHAALHGELGGWHIELSLEQALRASDEILEGTRQDKESDYRNRVANWDAFEAAVRANPKGEKMLNWAERIP